MGGIIIWGIFTLVAAAMYGIAFHLYIHDDTGSKSITIFFLLLIMSIFTICIIFYLNANQQYYERKEYPSAEYNINRKIITREEDNAIKMDTLYYFTRKEMKDNL